MEHEQYVKNLEALVTARTEQLRQSAILNETLKNALQEAKAIIDTALAKFAPADTIRVPVK